ncbi:acyl carrier protein [Streptomyces halobius]|uniref:Acyl carrier protein n=1 Tax=Streptomyces halobius TaxID=2879846 RepID=A0ABY4ML82_9ACTN|nr:acyl carrier protein [Streptomyces halobius]UQA97181.1 acyl carrier protein [Streptomyces halobius]
MTNNTYEWIAGLLTEHLGVPEDIIQPDATFTDLDLDSLSIAELSVIIEDRLGVHLTEEDLKPTLGEFCQVVDERRDDGKAAGADTAQQDASTTPTSP